MGDQSLKGAVARASCRITDLRCLQETLMRKWGPSNESLRHCLWDFCPEQTGGFCRDGSPLVCLGSLRMPAQFALH